MSVELDRLLEEMNALARGRGEDSIGMTDSYWTAKANYQRALNAANGVHVPVKANLGVDEVSAKRVAVAKAAEAHAEDLKKTAQAAADAAAKAAIAESELKAAEERATKEADKQEDVKTTAELELDAKKAAFDLAVVNAKATQEAHNIVKDNPPNLEAISEDKTVVQETEAQRQMREAGIS